MHIDQLLVLKHKPHDNQEVLRGSNEISQNTGIKHFLMEVQGEICYKTGEVFFKKRASGSPRPKSVSDVL